MMQCLHYKTFGLRTVWGILGGFGFLSEKSDVPKEVTC